MQGSYADIIAKAQELQLISSRGGNTHLPSTVRKEKKSSEQNGTITTTDD